MEETSVMTSVVESAPLWLNPLIWIVGLIVLGFVYEFFWGNHLKNSSPKSEKANKTSSSKPKRARGKKGKFLADDPSTPQNEAWVGGKAPKKKAAKKTAKKRATKKATRKRTPKKGGK